MSMNYKFPVLMAFVIWMTVQASAADIKEAMVVSFSGTVEIFSDLKGESSPGQQSLVVFDGQKYASRRVQSGTKVRPGDILRTGNDGKMKIIYNTGDVFILGPATAFQVPQKLQKGAAVEINSELLYGKIRGMIDKKGPLSGVQIKTQSIVSGVRGTDLYMTYNPVTQYAQVHVLRGKVQVTFTHPAENSKPTFVKTGEKAIAESKPDSKEVPAIQVLASNQADLKSIQTQTTTPAPALQGMKEEEKKEIQTLVKTSQEMVMEDIKTTTPDVYKNIQNKKVASLEDINQVVVQTLEKSAPKGPTKPKMSDFDQNEDLYQKYFKPIQQK